MSSIVSLLVMGDSISAHTAPYFELAGLSDNGITDNADARWNVPANIDPATSFSGIGDNNRRPFVRTGTSPPLLLMNAAIPGTNLTSSGGPTAGENYAPVAIDPLLRPAISGATPRLFIVSMFYSNPSDVDPAVAVARVVNWFNARKAVATANGATLACMTLTIPSRTDGVFGEVTYRVPYNNIIKDPAWQTANGIYTADLTGISALSDVNAANNTANFPDHIHPTYACMHPATAVVRSTVNAIIAANTVIVSGLLAATDALDFGLIAAEFKKPPKGQRSPVPYYSRRDYGWVNHARPPLM